MFRSFDFLFCVTTLFRLAIAFPAPGASLSEVRHGTTTGDTIATNGTNIKHSSSINLPIAASWMYISEGLDFNNKPQIWDSIDFKIVDVLNIAPLGIQADGRFGLKDSKETGPLANRFKWVIQRARTQNPDIKIIVSQFWGNTPREWGNDTSTLKDSNAIEKYTDSVKDFLNEWVSFYGGIDGYDVDYESSNVSPNITTIFSQVRQKLDALSKEHNDRPFYVTVSPSETTYLNGAVSSLNFVNMQTYEGSFYTLEPREFIDMGFKSTQLLYGINAEPRGLTLSVKRVEKKFRKKKLAGIHLWRLNSNNQHDELGWQWKIYNYLHGT